MDSVFSVYKPLGETPLQVLEKLRAQYPELEKQTLAYAGRLDPMAEGVLLVLKGTACKKREEYQKLPKTYVVEILCGVTTDSYDTLGLVTTFQPQVAQALTLKNIQAALHKKKGKFRQEYPPFSAARVKGKPLYYWARRGVSVSAPVKECEIYAISLTDTYCINSQEVLSVVESRTHRVHGNFRQLDVINMWHQYVSTEYTFPIIQITVSCSSGTYMRSLAHDLGKMLATGAIAYSIKRTQVGEFEERDAIRLS